MSEFDIVIVGGGSSGCVLASRLSENKNCRVLLIEAGKDTPPDEEPDDVLDSYPGRAYLNPEYTWPQLKGYLRPVPHNAPERPPLVRYEQARVMGGGSSINGQVASRGFPQDYDGWALSGAEGWGWSNVLPFFRKLENDLDFGGPSHGKDGPVSIRRVLRNEWDGLTRATGESFDQMGFAYREDMNASADEGYSPAPYTNSGTRRISTAMAYLGAKVRARSNLSIQPDTSVRRVLFEGRHAVGVEIEQGGVLSDIRAKHVFVTAGAIHTPALLQRSGVGPGRILREFGVDIVADRGGVGAGLQDHAAVSISVFLKKENRFDERSRRHIHMHLRYSSGIDGCEPLDMVVNTATRSAWHPLGQQIGSFQIFVGKPYSRGQVAISAVDPNVSPEIRFELLSDERDRLRLMNGMRLMGRALQQPPLRATALDPFPSSYSSRVRSIGRLKLSNRIMSGAAAAVMEGPAWMRRAFIRTAIARGPSLSDLLSDDVALSDFVADAATPTWHPCSTCRMGRADDNLAVTDRLGQVYGVEGLSVADASLMPEITRGNTGLPTIMIAEKIASDWIARR